MISASDLAKRFRDAAVKHAESPGAQPVLLIVVAATADPEGEPGVLTRVSIATSNNFHYTPDSEDIRHLLEHAIDLTHEADPSKGPALKGPTS